VVINTQGEKIAKFGNIARFTNLEHKKRYEELILYKNYSPEEYPKYDNYEAINVNKVADIPCDYEGVMGVPITFLDKFNPDQFEIIGATESE
jgi:modification methylase ecoRI family protein